MTDFFKNIASGYIIGISKGAGQTEVTESEYDSIMSVIQARPTPPEGKGYKLKADLTWEEYNLPEPEEEDATEEDYQNALEELGVNCDEEE